jgi:short-subunit dehydrogenase
MQPLHHVNETVLITGASSGIGEALAQRLAREGSNLVLVARRGDRLELTAGHLRQQHGVEVHVLVADLSQAAAGRTLLAATRRRGIAVTSVVNNAGFGVWDPFDQSDPQRLADMIAVNVTALTDISRAFIPILRENRHGYLVNITSLAAYSSIPMQGAYSATKAFVLSLTEALWAETRGTGVRVLAYAPGVTRTGFVDVLAEASSSSVAGAEAGPSQTPAQVVDGLIRQLNRPDAPPSWVSGHINHVIAVLPRYFTRRRAVLMTAARTMRNR